MSDFHRDWNGDESGSHRPKSVAPLPPFEAQRLADLRHLEPFARDDDPVILSVACQAMDLCGAPVGFVSFLGADEERFVVCVGYRIRYAERTASFCAHAILEPDVTVVEDTHSDPRFRDNPFVVEPPHIRFYIGAPIRTADGMPIGTVCVVDFAPREASPECLPAMRNLAAVTLTVLEIHRLFAANRSREMSPEAQEVATARLDELLLGLVAPRSA